MSTPVILALTAGEPAGIGPELCLQLATGSRDAGLGCVFDARLSTLTRSEAISQRFHSLQSQ